MSDTDLKALTRRVREIRGKAQHDREMMRGGGFITDRAWLLDLLREMSREVSAFGPDGTHKYDEARAILDGFEDPKENDSE